MDDETFDPNLFLENAKDAFSPHTEPSPEVTKAATNLYDLYVGLRRAGFDEGQTLFLIAEMMKAGNQ